MDDESGGEQSYGGEPSGEAETINKIGEDISGQVGLGAVCRERDSPLKPAYSKIEQGVQNHGADNGKSETPEYGLNDANVL